MSLWKCLHLIDASASSILYHFQLWLFTDWLSSMEFNWLPSRCFSHSTVHSSTLHHNLCPSPGSPLLPLSPVCWRHTRPSPMAFGRPSCPPPCSWANRHHSATTNLKTRIQNNPTLPGVDSIHLHAQNLLSSDTNLMQSPLYLPSRNISLTQGIHNRLVHPQGTKNISKITKKNPDIIHQ